MSPRCQAATSASGFMSSTVTSFSVSLFVRRKPSSRKWEVEPNGVATFFPLKSAGLLMLAAFLTIMSSAVPMLISAPLPASLQEILAFVISSNHPSPLAIMVGLVSRKKATLIFSGAAARAARPRTASVPPAAAAVRRRKLRRVRSMASPSCLVSTGPVHHPQLDPEEQPVEEQPQQAEQHDAHEDVLGAEEAAGV